MKRKQSVFLILDEIRECSEAKWVVWIRNSSGRWKLEAFSGSYRSKKEFQSLLKHNDFLEKLSTASETRKTRNYITIVTPAIKFKKIFTFSRSDKSSLLLVGADSLTLKSKRICDLGTKLLTAESGEDNQSQRIQEALQELENSQQELQARIAAQQAAESRLIQTTKLAAVGEMAAGVAHELNNPLTTVVGFSELLLESIPLDSPQRADIEVILKEARRARDVVRRLLDFSRQSETVRTRGDINEAVRDVLSLMQHLFISNGIAVSVSLGEMSWVLIDRNQMKQVFLNLMHNALNAMPLGGELKISSSVYLRYGKPYAGVMIKDTGVGISPENLQRIFEPFFTTRADKGGTGLGLSVTYGIISEHNGAIEVESAPGSGSTFTVLLPIEESR